jgi:protein SCO1/2
VSPAERGCTRVEEAVSARIDGEDPGMSDEIIDAHLERCPTCRSFEAQARAQHRRYRVRRADGIPDLSAAILAAVPDGPSPRPRLTIGNRAVNAPMVGVAAIVLAVVLVAGFVIGGHLAHGGSGGNGVAIAQIEGSDQENPAYPGATVLPKSAAVGKPDVVMTDTAGQPYNVATETRGKVTLLYFGYTHCPDLCPYNMALAAEAIHGLPPAMRRDVTMVFVTTDPTRDTPPVIKRWLSSFTQQFPGDPAFVGLTAPQSRIHAAEKQIHMLLSYAAQIDSKTGKYDVVHAAYTQVYSQSGASHLQVNYTTSPADYTKTLEDLIRDGGNVQ